MKREKKERNFGFVQGLSCMLAFLITMLSIPTEAFSASVFEMPPSPSVSESVYGGKIGNNENLDLTVDEATYSSVTDAIYGPSASYLITLKKGKNPDKFAQKKLLRSKANKKSKKTNIIEMKLNLEEARLLQTDEDVLYIEPNAIASTLSIGEPSKEREAVRQTSLGQQIIPWGIHSIGADLVMEKDNRVRIALLDTGVAEHEDLNVAERVSFVEGTPAGLDDNGHGTHVAGTIAALDNEIGVVGVAPNADLYSVKVLDASGNGTYGQIIQGIEWAIENQVNVISMSFGGSSYSHALEEAIRAATDAGIIVVASSGNQGYGEETELYPGRLPEVISVGAVNKTHQWAYYSSSGNEVDLVAPGTEILSTTMDGQYGVLSGTSMAVPHVTGSIAVLWSKHPEWSKDQVLEQLYSTATSSADAKRYGHGLINLAKAMEVTDSPIAPVFDTAEFDSIRIDQELLQLQLQLQAYTDAAKIKHNQDAEELLKVRINELLERSNRLHELPSEMLSIPKEEQDVFLYESNKYYEQKSEEFTQLLNDYYNATVEFSYVTKGNEVEITGTEGDASQQDLVSQTVTFPERLENSSPQQKTVKIPYLKGVTSVTTSNGTVSSSVDGENVTVTVQGGNPRQVNNPTKYSKSAKQDVYRDSESQFPLTWPYSEDGYSGELPREGNPNAFAGSVTTYPNKTINQTNSGDSTTTFPSYIVYDDADGYHGALYTTGTAYQKTLTKTGSRTASTSDGHPEYIVYDDGAYRGALYKTGTSSVVSGSYTAPVQKTVTDVRTGTATTTFPEYLVYDDASGYHGAIYKSGTPYQQSDTKYGTRDASTSDGHPEYIVYDDGTYKGILYKSGTSSVISGSYVAPQTKTVNDTKSGTASTVFTDYIVYDDTSGYHGALYKTGSKYQASKSASATRDSSSSSGHPSSVSYDSGGYSGTLSKSGSSYVISGSYTPSSSKSFSDSCSNTVTEYYKYGVFQSQSSSGSCPSSISINSDGYSGSIPRTSTDSVSDSGACSSTKASCTRTKTYRANYSGTLTKAAVDTRVWRQDYSGTVYGSTYYQDYRGDVTKPGSDSRVWRQSYRGSVYSNTYYQDYRGDVTKPGTDTRVWSQDYRGVVSSNAYYQDYRGEVAKPPLDTRQWVLRYSGNIYKAGIDNYYGYVVTIKANITPPDTTPPTAPTNLRVESIGDLSAQLTWNPSAEADVNGYYIYRNGLLNGTVSKDSTSFRAEALNPQTAYTFTVKAFDTTGNLSPASNALSVTTLPLNNTPIPISAGTYVDISLPAGNTRQFSITPSATGTYHLFTSSYGNEGGTNDTVLSLYADSSFTNLLSTNDDANANRFSQVDYSMTAGTTYYVKVAHYDLALALHARFNVQFLGDNTPPTENPEVYYDWYYQEETDDSGNTIEVYYSDIAGTTRKTPGTIRIIKKASNDTVWKEYSYDENMDSFSDTGLTYAVNPILTEGANTNSLNPLKIFRLKEKINQKKQELLQWVYEKTDLVPEFLSSENVRMLYTGISFSVDDNVLLGFIQWLYRASPPNDNLYFLIGRVFADSIFSSAFAIGSSGSAAAAYRSLESAGVLGIMAAGTSATGVGGVTFGAAAVSQLGKAGILAGVSVISGAMAVRSANILLSDGGKLLYLYEHNGNNIKYKPNESGYFGTTGNNPKVNKVRNISGGDKAAKEFFEEKTKGYVKEVVEIPDEHIRRQLNDGTWITYRKVSSSPDKSPAVDIYGGNTYKGQKIHFVE
ncbi:S8 family serine peptidase [Gorillibacterium sp. sgz500922]|uniref:S8 family serine peptidase n=1 Tax=Gorillibacterium sp. sgz500922 TaxID=3446694 RepID=UPI003F677EB5